MPLNIYAEALVGLKNGSNLFLEFELQAFHW